MADARQLWQTALGELQLLMTRANYETWLANSQGLGFDGEVLRVGVHSPFTQEALATRFAPLVRRTLASVVGQPLEVRYEIAGVETPASAPEPLFRQPEPRRPTGSQQRSAVVGRRSSVTDVPLPAPTRSPLNPRYTFATYVVGGGNRLAQAAAQAVADAPGRTPTTLSLFTVALDWARPTCCTPSATRCSTMDCRCSTSRRRRSPTT